MKNYQITKGMKSWILAAIILFETIFAGYIPVNADVYVEEENISANTVVSENTLAVNEDLTDINAEDGTEEPFTGASGKSGDLYWNITADGHLTVSGNGNYAREVEYKYHTKPYPKWGEYAQYIKTAEVNVTGITDTSEMFFRCYELETIDLQGLDMSRVTNMSWMFGCCYSLLEIDMHGMDLRKVKDVSDCFYDCSNLYKCDFTGVKTANLKNISGFVQRCTNIQELDLSMFDFSNVTEADDMFIMFNSIIKITLPPIHFEIDLNDVYTDENGKETKKAYISDKPMTYYSEIYTGSPCYERGHEFGKPEFIWNGLESAIARFVCKDYPCYIPEYTFDIPATIQTVTKRPTYSEDGSITYTATAVFNHNTYIDNVVIILPAYKNLYKADNGKPVLSENSTENKTDEESKIDSKKVSKGTILAVSGAKYKVTKIAKNTGTVEYVAPIKKTKKSVTIPATIKAGGVTYKVTAISNNAFKNNKKLTKIYIGKNITKIGSKAFYGCKKLKTIKIYSKKLKSIGKSAIKGIHKKAEIDVPNNKMKVYSKLFKKKTGYKNSMKMK